MDRREFLLALALAPSALAHEPLAYVTADTESHVVLVGMTTGKVYRRIPTAPSPFSIERVGTRAVVAHTVSGRVTVLEQHEIEGLGEPRLRDERRVRDAARVPRADRAAALDDAGPGRLLQRAVRGGPRAYAVARRGDAVRPRRERQREPEGARSAVVARRLPRGVLS